MKSNVTLVQILKYKPSYNYIIFRIKLMYKKSFFILEALFSIKAIKVVKSENIYVKGTCTIIYISYY